MTTRLATLAQWVDDVASLTKPDAIHWCDGSDSENAELVARMEADGALVPLNVTTYPNCYLHQSNPNDVARATARTCRKRPQARPEDPGELPEHGGSR